MNKISTIRLLSPELSNQIAAGEVVERPASIVKELVENSIDANAAVIEVDLENGGQTLIRVTDNGDGIPKEQLKLAVTRHATSKIAAIGDLLHINTFGFRGEALPSIASVSRFRITSSHQSENSDGSASGIEVLFGEIKEIFPTALNRGTRIEVENLFSNIPARLKFLKSPSSELKKAEDIFTRMALVHLNITFIFRSGNKELIRYTAGEMLLNRISRIWPQSVVDSLIPFDFNASGIYVHGYTSNPRSSQPRSDRIFLYVNGRPINDKILLRAIRQAYQGSLTTRDYPQTVLFLQIPSEEIDVNVHPSKNEIRFRDESSIFNAVYHAIHSAVSSQITETFCNGNRHFTENTVSESILQNSYSSSREYQPKVQKEDIPFILRDNRPMRESFFSDVESGSDIKTQKDYRECDTEKKNEFSQADNPIKSCQYNTAAHEMETLPYLEYPEKNRLENPGNHAFDELHLGEYLGQIAKNYLVFKLDDETLLIADQHAIHERIFYERLKKEGMAGKMQSLLIPLRITLHHTEQSRFAEVKEHITKLGFQVQIQGADCTITGIPQEMDRGDALEFLKKIFSEQIDSLDEIWIHHACATAIRSGQQLSKEDALLLMKKWAATKEPDYCPHGRPCSILLGKKELETLFKRHQQ